MQSSNLSLQEAVDAAHLATQVISPSSSKGTGATGSTEAPGCATASLIGSIATRQATESFSVGGVEKRSSTRGTSSQAFQSVRSSSRASSSRISSGYNATHNLVIGGALLESPSDGASDASWSQISSTPSPQIVPNDAAVAEETFKLEEMEEVSTTSFVEQYLSVTDSQEEEGLVKSVTRSQSDFSNWLADTMAHARGDGTSTVRSISRSASQRQGLTRFVSQVDSEEAYNAVADATRQARMGFTYSQAGSECGLLASPFSSERGRRHPSHIRSQPSSTASFLHRSGLMSQLDQLLDEEKPMAEEEFVEAKKEEVEETLEAQELPCALFLPLCSTTDFFWTEEPTSTSTRPARRLPMQLSSSSTIVAGKSCPRSSGPRCSSRSSSRTSPSFARSFGPPRLRSSR